MCWWDDRNGGKPEGEINLSVSHSDPVDPVDPVDQDNVVSSKTISEFFTASTDGTVGWEYSRTNMEYFVSRCCGGISGCLTIQ